MTKHHLALGIYQKKHLKKFINYKNKTQNHINSNLSFQKSTNHQFVDFLCFKASFHWKKESQKAVLFESGSNQARICFGKRVLFSNKTRTWLDFDSTLTATKLIKFIVFRFWMKNISKKFFFSPTLKVGKISWKFYQNYTF